MSGTFGADTRPEQGGAGGAPMGPGSVALPPNIGDSAALAVIRDIETNLTSFSDRLDRFRAEANIAPSIFGGATFLGGATAAPRLPRLWRILQRLPSPSILGQGFAFHPANLAGRPDPSHSPSRWSSPLMRPDAISDTDKGLSRVKLILRIERQIFECRSGPLAAAFAPHLAVASGFGLQFEIRACSLLDYSKYPFLRI